MPANIRLATEIDAAAVQAVYAPYVRDTVISFELEPPSVTEMAGRIGHAVAWLVCTAGDGSIIGYAYASKHRERAAYQWSVDVSAYIHPGYHRRGVGRGLYAALFGLLRLQGYYNAYAGITLPNEASVGLHTALGFEPVGVYRGVGYKFGAWWDVAWLSLRLQALVDAPEAPRAVGEVVDRPEARAALAAGAALCRV